MHRVAVTPETYLSVAYRSGFGSYQPAQLLIVHQFGNGGMLAAQRAVGIAPDADLAEPHGQRIVQQQAPYQRGSPWPIMSLIVSVAWMTPITPGNTPKTPTSLHDGTMPGGGGVG